MAKVLVVGGGIVGLCGATLLARDGHEVTVIERDAEPPPTSPLEAWGSWQRRGVNQFRQLHYFLPNFRQTVEAELPDLAVALETAGALRFNPLRAIPPDRTGGWREEDARFDTITGRRPMVEATVAAAVAAEPGVTVRRGTAVTGLQVDGDMPHAEVVGVAIDTGEVIGADVVVDAGGRRSPMANLLAAAGMTPPQEERHDHGFVYYARHFRAADGSVPTPIGPLLQPCGSVSIVTLPADNGYWGVGIVASARDETARSLRRVEVWERVLKSCPLVAHWQDGECISDDVEIMAKIEDRYRHFCVDGQPVAPGVLPLGDAFACTNPSLGRGASIGLRHAVALRDLLRTTDLDDRGAVSLAWDDVTAQTVGPYVRDTLTFDEHRLNEIEAVIAGTQYATDDPSYHLGRALNAAAFADRELLRLYLDVVSVHARGVDVLSQPGIAERVIPFGAGLDAGPMPYVGPDRDELVSLLRA